MEGRGSERGAEGGRGHVAYPDVLELVNVALVDAVVTKHADGAIAGTEAL